MIDLNLLREKDPATCEIYEQEAGCFQFDDQRRGWILQGVLQEACQTRGWRYIQSSHYKFDENVIYGADIRDHENYDISKGVGDSPAEALLAAYLGAIG